MVALLAGISGKAAIKKFEKLGYRVVRQKGSHVRLWHTDSFRKPLTVPLQRELKIGLISQLISDAGINKEMFLDL